MTGAVRTALRLGRVSNLPTVWTNVLAGMILNGKIAPLGVVVPVGLAMSLAYVAGMYLNDAFDHGWDAQHRPERPIPAGEVGARTVLWVGFGMLAASLVALRVGAGPRSFEAGVVLAALIVVYDLSHKRNPLAPLVMGLCRVGVYATAGLSVAPAIAPALAVGASILLAYLIALSVVARSETRDPRLPRLVGFLIAGIALLDGAIVAVLGHFWMAGACVAAFVLTRRLQRHVPGT
jgi:4-hydroxybenzoate polyprenyltransferase